MNKITKLFYSFLYLGLTVVGFSTNSFAQEDKNGFLDKPKVYLGAGVGSAAIDTGVTATTGTARLDENSVAFKGLLGIQLHKHIAIEGFYANFGKASLTGNNGDTFVLDGTTYTFTANSVEVTAKATTIGLGLVGIIPVNDTVAPIIKLGFHSWETDYSVTSSAGNGALSDSGTDLFFGLGAQFNLNEKIAMRAMFERFNFDDEDVDFISAGLILTF